MCVCGTCVCMCVYACMRVIKWCMSHTHIHTHVPHTHMHIHTPHTHSVCEYVVRVCKCVCMCVSVYVVRVYVCICMSI